MTRLHEEWLTLAVDRLGNVANEINYVSGSADDAFAMAHRIALLRLVIEHWEKATRETTADGKLAVEEAFERTGAGWS